MIGIDPYRSGSWNRYRLRVSGKDYNGFKVWKTLPREEPLAPKLEPTEFDALWLPVLHRVGPYADRIIFFTFAQMQKLPLKGDKDWQASSMVIDLTGFEHLSRQPMASA